MKRKINIEVILFSLTILASLLFIVALFSRLVIDNNYINTFFNSDTLYLPSIYKDLFIDHNGFKGWHLSGAPNFFPDMILYFIIMIFSKNFIVSSFLFSTIQYLFFLFLIYKLIRLIIPNHTLLFASISNICLMLVFLVTFYSHDFNFTFLIVSISYHMSAFLMSFLCLIISLNYLKKPKNTFLIVLFLIGILCIVSDKLFIVLYSVPIFSLVVFYKKIIPGKKIIFLLITDLITVGIGLFLFHYISSENYITIPPPSRNEGFDSIVSSFNILMEQNWVYLKDFNFKTVIVFSSIISFGLVIYLFIKNIRKDNGFSLIRVYCFFSIVYTLFVFFAPVMNGNYLDWGCQRYNVYVFYISLVNFGVITAYNFDTIRKTKLYLNLLKGVVIVFIITAFSIIFIQLSLPGLNKYFSYYPDKVKCIDELAKKEKLLCGVGNYWDAKYITMFSKKNVKVYAAFDDLTPFYHNTNPTWFHNENALFNFIILDDFSGDEYKEKIGNNFIKVKSECLDIIKVPTYRFNRDPLTIYFADSLKVRND